MKEQTDEFVRTIDLLGHYILMTEVTESDLSDTETKKQSLLMGGATIVPMILNAIGDISEKALAGIITPVSRRYKSIESILASVVKRGRIQHQLLEGHMSPVWVSLECLAASKEFHAQYHRENPSKDRFGELDMKSTVLRVKNMKEDVDHIIYAHWHLDVTASSTLFLSPTIKELKNILAKVELYGTTMTFETHGAQFTEQQAYIRKVDNTLKDYGISPDGWKPAYNDLGHKRHLRREGQSAQAMNIYPKRIEVLMTVMLPTMRSELEKFETPEDTPHARPWV